MSIIVIATAIPQPEFRDEVLHAFEVAAAATQGEDGCELYALHQGDDRIVLIEKWSGQDALDVHMKGQAVIDLGGVLRGRLTGRLDVQVLRPQPAGTAAKGTI